MHNSTSFCVSVSLMRQGMAEEGLAEEMYEAIKKGEEIPQADVEITASDRPTIQQVLAVLAELNDQVRRS